MSAVNLRKAQRKKGLCKILIDDIFKYGHHMALILHIPKKMEENVWIKLSKKIIDQFPDISLILSPLYDGQDFNRFVKTAHLAKILNIPLLASAYPIMHHNKRRRIVDVLSAIRNNCTIDELGHLAEKMQNGA